MGTRKCCGVVDNVSYIQGSVHCSGPHSSFGNYSPPTHFNCPSEQAVGSLEGGIGLPALQPVPCLSESCMGGEGPGCLVYKYASSIGNCTTWCNIPAPSSCRSLVPSNP